MLSVDLFVIDEFATEDVGEEDHEGALHTCLQFADEYR